MDPLKELEQEIKVVIERLKEEVAKIRSNRPTPKLVEHIKVDYFNQVMTVNQLAAISVVSHKEINIAPWDAKSIPVIVKALDTANLGISVKPDGNLIRVSLPPFTEERIREFTKLVKSIGEDSRIRMRSMRDKVIKKINEFPESQRFKMKNELQKIVDKFNEEVENIIENKIKEFGN